MSDDVRVTLPEEAAILSTLEAGTKVLLSGVIYTMRDAGHVRCLAYLREHGELPFGLAGQVLFYAGPTPERAGRPFGAIGPTTASRMDFAAPELYRAGIVSTIGKGKRSREVVDACRICKATYLACVGGVAALLAERVTHATCVAWEDLGTEALWRIEVEDLPAFVEVDATGRDLYREIEASADPA